MDPEVPVTWLQRIQGSRTFMPCRVQTFQGSRGFRGSSVLEAPGFRRFLGSMQDSKGSMVPEVPKILGL